MSVVPLLFEFPPSNEPIARLIPKKPAENGRFFLELEFVGSNVGRLDSASFDPSVNGTVGEADGIVPSLPTDYS